MKSALARLSFLTPKAQHVHGLSWLTNAVRGDVLIELAAIVVIGLFVTLVILVTRRLGHVDFSSIGRDEFEEVLWKWEYSGQKVRALRALCTVGATRLVATEAGTPYAGRSLPEPRTFLRCPICNKYKACCEGSKDAT